MKMKLSVALVPNVNFQVSAGVLINMYRLCLWWRCPGENMCGLWSWILDFGTWRAAWEVVWKYPCILGWNLRWFGDTKNDLVNIQKNSIPDHVNPLEFYKGEIGVCQPDLITMYITGTQTHYWAVLPGLQLLAECKLSMRWSLICSRRWPKEKWLGPISKLDWTLLSLSLSLSCWDCEPKSQFHTFLFMPGKWLPICEPVTPCRTTTSTMLPHEATCTSVAEMVSKICRMEHALVPMLGCAVDVLMGLRFLRWRDGLLNLRHHQTLPFVSRIIFGILLAHPQLRKPILELHERFECKSGWYMEDTFNRWVCRQPWRQLLPLTFFEWLPNFKQPVTFSCNCLWLWIWGMEGWKK